MSSADSGKEKWTREGELVCTLDAIYHTKGKSGTLVGVACLSNY